MDCWTYICLV